MTSKHNADRLTQIPERSGAAVTANLLMGLGIDEVLTRTDGAGTRGFLTDALGSTIALVDNTGAVLTQYTYEPFGAVNRIGTASQNSYTFTGREDDGSGLYYYRARYYHPRLQRFISEDPLGIGGGLNLYKYVRNNPLRLTDPTGLGPISFMACTFLNASKQIHDWYSYLATLDEATKMTHEMLARVNAEIMTCSDADRLIKLGTIRNHLEVQLDQLIMKNASDYTMAGLYQVAEGLIWESACVLMLVSTLP